MLLFLRSALWAQRAFLSKRKRNNLPLPPSMKCALFSWCQLRHRVPTIRGHCGDGGSSLGTDVKVTPCVICSVVYTRSSWQWISLGDRGGRKVERLTGDSSPTPKGRQHRRILRPGSKDRIPGHPFGFTVLKCNLIQGQTSSSPEV